MRYTKPAAITILICTALAAGAAAANAAPVDNLSCIRADREVRTALDSNKTSANYDAAMARRNAGLRACHNGFFKMGMENYSAALKLLGAEKKADLPRT